MSSSPTAPVGASSARSDAQKLGLFSNNIWENVSAPDDGDELARTALERHRRTPVAGDRQAKLNATPSSAWHGFYQRNKAAFFQDRKWLKLEFPELFTFLEPEAGEAAIMEVGCGAGNTVFPLAAENRNQSLALYACDYASSAIEVVKSNSLYASPPCGAIQASMWDLSAEPSAASPLPVAEGTLDVLVMIFVFSALHPDQWRSAVQNAFRLLKPYGLLLFRDYGANDLAQLQMKDERYMSERFYIRGDDTRVYFFELDEVASIFAAPQPEHPDSPCFSAVKQDTIRRAHVNRKLERVMYRIFQQLVLRKVAPGRSSDSHATESLP